MKKILLFSLIACMGVVGFSYAERTRTCGPSTLGFDGNQDPDDDEFLYENQREFDLTMSGYQSTGHQTSGDGRGWECDGTNSGSCTYGERTKRMPVGHYFQGQKVNVERMYECGKGRGDAWVPVCENCVKKCTTKWGDINVGKKLSKNKSTIECSGMEYTEAKELGVEWEVICRAENHVVCKPVKCIDGYKVNITTGKCDKDCPDCDKDDPQPNSCKQSRSTEEGKACCDFRKDIADWNGKNCVCADSNKEFKKGENGKWGCWSKIIETCETKYAGDQNRINCCNAENRGEAVWVDALKRCECQNAEQKWDEKSGKCADVPNDNNELSDCWYQFNFDITCNNGKGYKKGVKAFLTKEQARAVGCTSGQAYEQYSQMTTSNLFENAANEITGAQKLIELVCGKSGVINPGVPVVDPKPTVDVEVAKQTLRKFFANAKDKASVWKTEDGSFNTARLASDLTAGVVLGTVGGVVSGHIIKKKQIEKGFEVLHCTVGGQTVAGWGDEFSVGLRK